MDIDPHVGKGTCIGSRLRRRSGESLRTRTCEGTPTEGQPTSSKEARRIRRNWSWTKQARQHRRSERFRLSTRTPMIGVWMLRRFDASLFPTVRAKAWTGNRKDVQVSRARRIDVASGIRSWTCLARICQDVFGSRATRVSEAVLFFPPSNWRHPSSLGRARNSAGRSVCLRSRTNRAMSARGLVVAVPLVSSPRGQGSSFLCRRVLRRFVSRLQVSCSSFPQHTGQVTVPCPWHVLHFAMPTLFATPAPPGRVCTSPTPSHRLQMSSPHPFLQLGHAWGRATTRLSKYAGRLGPRLSPSFSCAQACHRGAHPRPTMPSTCVSMRHTDPFFSFSNPDRPGSVPGSNPNLAFLPLPFPRESKPTGLVSLSLSTATVRVRV